MKNLPENLCGLAATDRITNVPSVAGNEFPGNALAHRSGTPSGA